jgi:hypothetical protein
MIIKKYWTAFSLRRCRKSKPEYHRDCMGLFLFGFLPIYVRIGAWY